MRKSKGFTLLELIITIAILGIIIIPLSSIALTSVKFTKASEDKQRATNMAEKYMEKIKGADASIVSNNSLNYTEGNFDINCSIEAVDGYDFKQSSKSGDEGSDSILFDYRILFNKGNATVEFYKEETIIPISQQNVTNPYIEISSTATEMSFALKDGEAAIDQQTTVRSNEKESGKIKVKVEILRELPSGLTISVNNESVDILELYLVKGDDLTPEPEIIVEKQGGVIRQYNDLLKIQDTSSISDESNKRLYKVTVEVKNRKTGEILTVNKSYKTFLK